MSWIEEALARARDLLQHGALLRREALHGLDEVRNEVGASLVDVLHLGPLLVDALIEDDELVVHRDRPRGDTADEDDDHDQGDQEST